MADLDPGSGIFLTLDPGWKDSDPGSGINIPDPQHCYYAIQNTGFIQIYQYVRIGTVAAF